MSFRWAEWLKGRVVTQSQDEKVEPTVIPYGKHCYRPTSEIPCCENTSYYESFDIRILLPKNADHF